MDRSRMQERKRLAYMVIEEGVSVSEAARRLSVSRQTAHLWVKRAREEGIADLSERSRRPLVQPLSTPVSLVERLLSEKAKRPYEGAKKLLWRLYPDGDAPVCVRTVDRLLKKAGLAKAREEKTPPCRFERETCNELWQVDLKGTPKDVPYTPLSVLEDCSRYLLLLVPLESKSPRRIFQALWDLFEEAGLPESILTDNGDGFNDWRSRGPTWFESRLWLLGIRTPHGRPRHPQTQGKVERFHRTLKETLEGDLFQETAQAAKDVLVAFQNDYNWQRPHEALGMQVPGSRYQRSQRKRPKTMPVHHIETGTQCRKVDVHGILNYKGEKYRPGKGLAGEFVEIKEGEHDDTCCFAGVTFASLSDLKV